VPTREDEQNFIGFEPEWTDGTIHAATLGMKWRGILVCSGLALPIALACSSSDTRDVAGSAGVAGDDGVAGGGVGSGGDAQSGGGGGYVDPECPNEGSGTLVVDVTGLPDGVEPEVEILTPDGTSLFGPGTFDDVSAGRYWLEARYKFDDDPLVQTMFQPASSEISPSSSCLSSGSELTISVEYSAIPTSNKLWMASDGQLTGFSAADLAQSDTLAATVDIEGPVGPVLIFDKDGNIWTHGPTAADPTIVRFDADDLAESGAVEPVFGIDVPGIACRPAVRAMVFDGDGFLWLGTCDQRVLLFAEDDSEEYDVETEISGFSAIQSIAFDADGHLWVADDGVLERYDADPVEAPDALPEWTLAHTLSVRDATNAQALAASRLAFDPAGNLWATDPDRSTVFKLSAADLTGGGVEEVIAEVSIVPAEASQLGGLAFDRSEGLWLALGGGRFGKLGANQLGTSTDAGAPMAPEVVIQSSTVQNAGGLALFPAGTTLPLHHAW
jgi:hypothetical protein